jgi:hypothetical protein
MPSQQPQGQLQTQHSVDTGNYIHYGHTQHKEDKLQASIGGRNTLMQRSKQKNKIIIIIIIISLI